MSRIVRGLVEAVMFPGAEANHDTEDPYMFYIPAPQLRILIPVFIYPYACGSPVLIIYAHGNGTDIGSVVPELCAVSKYAKAHIAAFEYPGYGKCEGHISEKAVDAVSEYVLEFFIKQVSWPLTNIVLWGASIGSGIMCRLAQKIDTRQISFDDFEPPYINYKSLSWDPPPQIDYKKRPNYYEFALEKRTAGGCDCSELVECSVKNNRLGGLVLQCPFTSIKRAAQKLVGSMVTKMIMGSEWYNNESALEDYRGPLMIIHGRKDEMFDWRDSFKLIKEFKNGPAMGIFPHESTHNFFSFKDDIADPFKYFIHKFVWPRLHRVSLPLRSARSSILYTYQSVYDGPPLPMDHIAYFRPQIGLWAVLYTASRAKQDEDAYSPSEEEGRHWFLRRFRKRLQSKEPFIKSNREFLYRLFKSRRPVKDPFVWPDKVQRLVYIPYARLERVVGGTSLDPYPYMNYIPPEGMYKMFEVQGENDTEYELLGYACASYQYEMLLGHGDILMPQKWAGTSRCEVRSLVWKVAALKTVAPDPEDPELIQNLGLRPFMTDKVNCLKAFNACHRDVSRMFVSCKKRYLGSFILYLCHQYEQLTVANQQLHAAFELTSPLAATGKSTVFGSVTMSALRHGILTASFPCIYYIYKITDNSYSFHALFVNGFLMRTDKPASAQCVWRNVVCSYIPVGILPHTTNTPHTLGYATVLYDLFPFPEFLLFPLMHHPLDSVSRLTLASDTLKIFLEYENKQYAYPNLENYLCQNAIWQQGINDSIDYIISPTDAAASLLLNEDHILDEVVLSMHDLIHKVFWYAGPLPWLGQLVSLPADHTETCYLLALAGGKHVLPYHLAKPEAELQQQKLAVAFFKRLRDASVLLPDNHPAYHEKQKAFASAVGRTMDVELTEYDAVAAWNVFACFVIWRVEDCPKMCKFEWSKVEEDWYKITKCLVSTMQSDEFYLADGNDNSMKPELIWVEVDLFCTQAPTTLVQGVLDTLISTEAAEHFAARTPKHECEIEFSGSPLEKASQGDEDDAGDSKLWAAAVAAGGTRRLPTPNFCPEDVEHATPYKHWLRSKGVVRAVGRLPVDSPEAYLHALWFPPTPVGSNGPELLSKYKKSLEDIPEALYEIIKDVDMTRNDLFLPYLSYAYYCSIRLWRNIIKFRLLDLYRCCGMREFVADHATAAHCKHETACRLGVMFVHQWLSTFKPTIKDTRCRTWEEATPIVTRRGIKYGLSPHLPELQALQDSYVVFMLSLESSWTRNTKNTAQRYLTRVEGT